MQVHIFGATSSSCCSNKALRQTADDNEDKYGSEVAEAVRRNFYVDDLLKSVQTTDQATILAFNLIAMLKEGGFHLTKFLSNRREVLSALPSQERANPTLSLELDRLPINRTLGLHWDAERDTFCFQIVPTTKTRHEAWNSLHHQLTVRPSRISVTICAPSQSANSRSLEREGWMG